MTKQGIERARSVLRDRLPRLMRPMRGTDPPDTVRLERQCLTRDRQEREIPSTSFKRRRTYVALFNLWRSCLIDLQLTCQDFLTCSNPACQTVFVPLKAACGGAPVLWDTLLAIDRPRNFRKRNAAKLLASERKRNRKRYDEKLAKQLPGAKIRRQVRNHESADRANSYAHLQQARISLLSPGTFTRRSKRGSSSILEISRTVVGRHSIAVVPSLGSTLNSLPSIRISACPLFLTSFKGSCSIV